MAIKEEGEVKITSIGRISLNLHLTMKKAQINQYNIKLNDINTFEGVKLVLSSQNGYGNSLPSLVDYITLSSQNELISSLLYINRASKTKCVIEYIALGGIGISKENVFINQIVKRVTNKNHIFIIENYFVNKEPQIDLTVKVVDNYDRNKILFYKTFDLCDRKYENKRDLKGETNLFNAMNYKFDSEYFYSDIKELMQLKKNEYEEISLFFSLLIQNYPNINIITNFPCNFLSDEVEISLYDTIKDIIDYSDVIFYQKEDMEKFFIEYTEIYDSNNYNFNTNTSCNSKNKLPLILLDQDKIRKTINRTTIIIDKLINISVYEQGGEKLDIIEQKNFHCVFLNRIYDVKEEERKEFEEMLYNHYSLFNSIFIGAFLSRFVYSKTFTTCLTASDLLMKKLVDIIKNGKIDEITNLSFFQVSVPKKEKSIDKLNQMLFLEKMKQRENNFCLDCMNKEKSRIKQYNVLFDNSCSSFLQSRKKYLIRQGFINKKGEMLKDPSFNFPKKKKMMKELFIRELKNINTEMTFFQKTFYKEKLDKSESENNNLSLKNYRGYSGSSRKGKDLFTKKFSGFKGEQDISVIHTRLPSVTLNKRKDTFLSEVTKGKKEMMKPIKKEDNVYIDKNGFNDLLLKFQNKASKIINQIENGKNNYFN